MVTTFYIINGQGPGIKNPVIHPSITDDKFCIVFDTDGVESREVDEYKNFFNHTGASLVETKTI
jgi:hypothetical protein